MDLKSTGTVTLHAYHLNTLSKPCQPQCASMKAAANLLLSTPTTATGLIYLEKFNNLRYHKQLYAL